VIAPLVEILAVKSWKVVKPAAVPVLTVMSPEVLETSAPIQKTSAGELLAPIPSTVIAPVVDETEVAKKLMP
jgi:hypothetical protein